MEDFGTHKEFESLTITLRITTTKLPRIHTQTHARAHTLTVNLHLEREKNSIRL